MSSIKIRNASTLDLQPIIAFVDYWLTGGGFKDKAPGVVHDAFVTPAMHIKYITRYKTFLLTHNSAIIGWAVVQKDGSLIHFLISGYHRNKGLGSRLLSHINPHRIRSKSDQSSGDPGPFYQKHGYIKTDTVQSKRTKDPKALKPTRPKNIDIYTKIQGGPCPCQT